MGCCGDEVVLLFFLVFDILLLDEVVYWIFGVGGFVFIGLGVDGVVEFLMLVCVVFDFVDSVCGVGGFWVCRVDDRLFECLVIVLCDDYWLYVYSEWMLVLLVWYD